MDFKAAMQAHASWKIKLTGYATGISHEKLDPVATAKDNVCALGQWLHGEGKSKLANHAEYKDLVGTHAEFHRQAAALVRMIDAGQAEKARAQLDDPNSAYRQHSTKVIGLLMKMQDMAK